MPNDQFYTKEPIAIYCYKKLLSIIDINNFDIILEPSIGKGAFFNLLPTHKRVGIDIEPKIDDANIFTMNFFDFEPNVSKQYLTIGNPPFGKNSSLAIKFFNRASTFSNVIAFIVPRTFKRVSVQNKLDLHFDLIYNEDLPMNPCCFEPKMSAKCCFQIWQKTNNRRQKVILPTSCDDFSFLKLGPKDSKNQPTCPTQADFTIRAYGGKCGEIRDKNLHTLRPKSWHWIKSNININELKHRFKQLDYSLSKDTVRQNSIGQRELIHLYTEKFEK